jgi:hypothetical protein
MRHIQLLQLHPKRLLLPEIRQLLSASPPSKLHSPVCHIAFGPVHEALEANLVLWVVEVLIWMIRIQPSSAKVTEVRLALHACHVITAPYSDVVSELLG